MPDETVIHRYYHGGCRIFIQRESGARDIVADLYDDEKAERREAIITALIGAGIITSPPSADSSCPNK